MELEGLIARPGMTLSPGGGQPAQIGWSPLFRVRRVFPIPKMVLSGHFPSTDMSTCSCPAAGGTRLVRTFKDKTMELQESHSSDIGRCRSLRSECPSQARRQQGGKQDRTAFKVLRGLVSIRTGHCALKGPESRLTWILILVAGFSTLTFFGVHRSLPELKA